MNRSPRLASLLFVLATIPVSNSARPADDPDLGLLYADVESISIATGNATPLNRAPSVATIFTSEDILATGATHLDELLEAVPGLHVSRSFNRQNAIYSIRGIHTGQNPQVLVLINGIPITQLISGGRGPTFRMSTDDIERVEVIRGPGSAIYGADAFAGVIDITTKRGAGGPGTRVGGRLGSFERRDFWVQHSGRYGGWDVAFNLSSQHANGDGERVVDADLQSGLDTAFGTDASLTPTPLSTDYNILDTRLSLDHGNWSANLWSWIQNDAGNGPGGAQAIDHRGREDAKQWLADLHYRDDAIRPNWRFGADAYYLHLDRDSDFVLLPPGTMVPIGADGNIDTVQPVGLTRFTEGLLGRPSAIERTLSAELFGSYTGFSGHRIRISAGLKRQWIDTSESKNFGPGILDGSQSSVDGQLTDVSDTPFVFMEDSDRVVRHISIQDEWGFARDWELTAGLRYDHYSDFGETINPRLALVWFPRYDLTAKLLYGRAFRAPTFGELFFINNPALLGGKDLKPENIDTLELAVEYNPKLNLTLRAATYVYDVDRFIQPMAGSDGITRFENTEGLRGRGMELEGRWEATDRITLWANFALQSAKDKSTDARVPDAPGRQAYLRLDWRPNRDWLLNTQINRVMDRQRAPAMRAET